MPNEPGSIAVAESHRGRGLGTRLTARIARSLLETADHVGLNVRRDNRAAIACYERLGFTHVAPFEERELRARGQRLPGSRSSSSSRS